MILIHIHNNFDLSIDHQSTQNLINIIFKDYEIIHGEINLIITDDESLRKMKKEYFKQDYYTDVIAFNIQNNPFEGEIYVSYDRIKDNAIKYNQTFEKEIKRVVIHGALHLCGEKDETDNQKLKMKSLEDFYLKNNNMDLINS